MSVNTTPEGYHSITPYMIVDGAAAAIDFYKKALDAKELLRFPSPGGKVGHAELKIGDSHFMLADEHPEMEHFSPKKFGGTPVSLLVYVPNVDQQMAKAIAAGGTLIRPVEDQFYGDRSGQMKDPFGHLWVLSTHVEDVSPEELNRRMANLKK
jgi:PhnB protein